jgi:peptidoglycan DL-endopeptidase CwlO
MHASHQRATRALATLCAGAASTFVLTAAPAAAEPSVDEARDRLSTVQEKRDKTATQVRRLSKDLARAQAALRQTRGQAKAHEVALSEVEALIAEDPQDDLAIEAVAGAADVLRADDPTQALAEASAEAQEESLAPQTAEALERRISGLRERLAAQDVKVDRLRAKAKKHNKSLNGLKSQVATASGQLEAAREAAREARAAARERAREAERPTRSATRTTPAAPSVAGGAGAAVSYAMAQVGDAYSYGASGPDAFDCSGLTSMAWAQAGVTLPRSSGAQMGAGTPVSISALQPGDLVFYYSPVSHVGIYVGNGQLVHAANPSTGVQLTSVHSMPISGAVRPG